MTVPKQTLPKQKQKRQTHTGDTTAEPETVPKLTGELKEVIEQVRETVVDDIEVIEEGVSDAAKEFLGGRSRQIAIAIGAGMAFIAGGTWWALRQRRTRNRRLWQARGVALRRMWDHPELVARPAESSILVKAGKSLAVTAVATAAKRGGLRLLEKAWPE